MGRPLEAAMLLREGLTPFQISQRWGRNINTVLPYLDRAIGDKLPYGIPITKEEILLSIRRKRRELIRAAISKGEGPGNVWLRYEELWADVAEVRADFEVVRKYGEEASTSAPGDRLGYLFEDVWRIETRIASCLIRVLTETYGSEWWQQEVFPRLSEEQKKRLMSIQDVTLLDLMKLGKLFWTDVSSPRPVRKNSLLEVQRGYRGLERDQESLVSSSSLQCFQRG